MLKEAFALHQQGRFADAERLYARALKAQPGNFQLLHMMGVLAMQMGRPDQAVARLRKSLAAAPRQPLAHRDLGNALQMLNRPGEALASFDAALALKPDLAEAHNNRAVALAALGRAREALAGYGQAIALNPGYAKALNNRGAILVALNRHDEALADHARAIALAPHEAQGHVFQAVALLGLGRAEDALAAFDRALARDPAIAAAHDGRGTALALLGRTLEALESHQQALALDPASATAHGNRGTALAALGRTGEALEAHERALALDPDSATAHSNRGTALSQLDRLEEALESYDRAIALNPATAQPHINRGILLTGLGRHDEAMQSHDQALALAPQSAEALFNKATLLLLTGQYEQGWRCYEARKQRAGLDKILGRGIPRWTGAQDIAGKTLVIEAEQGLGDTIQFCRYGAMAAARGAHVILVVQENLVRLLRALAPAIEIRSVQEALPACDYHIFLLSLPLAFGTNAANIPADIPYLEAEAALVEKWRDRIGKAGFKIGVCWQGARNNPARSFPLVFLKGIAALPGVRLISLQKGPGNAQLQSLPPGMAVESLGADFDEGPDALIDTAAAMASLDLVITCDTSIAHLAGALGRPVWTALKFSADWRWLLGRADSPWYPGMHLFRQARRGDWSGVFAAMEEQLRQTRKP